MRRANAHFSNDLLSSLLNEPIIGQGVFWSSVKTEKEGSKPYPIPVRVFSFENMVKIRDRCKGSGPVENYARELKRRVESLGSIKGSSSGNEELPKTNLAETQTLEDSLSSQIAERFRADVDLMDNIKSRIPWGIMKQKILDLLPDDLPNKGDKAYNMVRQVMVILFGEENTGWCVERLNGTTYVRSMDNHE